MGREVLEVESVADDLQNRARRDYGIVQYCLFHVFGRSVSDIAYLPGVPGIADVPWAVLYNDINTYFITQAKLNETHVFWVGNVSTKLTGFSCSFIHSTFLIKYFARCLFINYLVLGLLKRSLRRSDNYM